MPLPVRTRETADETRERIARVAEALFRRMGYAKTAVADIAAELGMSPANVYRFFPSKNAIVEAICSRCLTEVEAQIRDIMARPVPARARLFDLFTAILAYHRANFFTERRIHDMVLVAIEANWTAIAAHKDRVTEGIAVLLRDGIAEGTFVPHDTDAASRVLSGAMVRFCHPILIAEEIDADLEARLHATLAFLLRSVEVDRTPF
ncbi:TetR/AcrR family transcriptional regulator [Aquabacter spiritensis]|uniref:TetR family transcriptional regulator n=1 Tax=Aquabacter spiritensis TaxID=933073 RepID=A0A4R3LV33_9HYPH|nr:TetR/AcrR family transcriptional regulator [Aquabacter spiritensis]TCT04404.1 TetR family transcriptional regulator [Aquabacter spiritensis]